MTVVTIGKRKRALARADIMPMAEYARTRKESRKRVAALKRDRMVDVGPFATFFFECYETMWHQVHEMLYIEKGGEEQIDGEIGAYNPLIPKGDELVATVMLQIEDPERRARVLANLGGIEHTMSLTIDGDKTKGVAEDDTDRTNAQGKASSVHFVHFPLSPAQA
ncbi:MAG: DUF3501 family protein, partial [Alphaproteobacteria bacterium]|nr:DUF3501 family protein [Alphaproteobacteria bacterium]